MTSAASAYPFLALFSVGLTLSVPGGLPVLRGEDMRAPLMLIATKILILPALTNAFVALLVGGTPESQVLGQYGFTYNMIATSPAVAVFSTQFEVGQKTIPAAIVYTMLLGGVVSLMAGLGVSSDIHSANTGLLQNQGAVSHVAMLSLVGALVFLVEQLRERFRGLKIGLQRRRVLNRLIPVLFLQIGTCFCSTSYILGEFCQPSMDPPTASWRFYVFFLTIELNKIWIAVFAIYIALSRKTQQGGSTPWRRGRTCQITWFTSLLLDPMTFAAVYSVALVVVIAVGPSADGEQGCWIHESSSYEQNTYLTNNLICTIAIGISLTSYTCTTMRMTKEQNGHLGMRPAMTKESHESLITNNANNGSAMSIYDSYDEGVPQEPAVPIGEGLPFEDSNLDFSLLATRHKQNVIVAISYEVFANLLALMEATGSFESDTTRALLVQTSLLLQIARGFFLFCLFSKAPAGIKHACCARAKNEQHSDGSNLDLGDMYSGFVLDSRKSKSTLLR